MSITLKVGDVISFMAPEVSDNTAICHRIIAIQYQKGVENFQTKGDANKSPDQFLTPVTNVKGREIFYISYIGRLADIKRVGTTPVNLIQTSLPLAVVIVAAMGLLFIGLVSKDTIEVFFGLAGNGSGKLLRKGTKGMPSAARLLNCKFIPAGGLNKNILFGRVKMNIKIWLTVVAVAALVAIATLTSVVYACPQTSTVECYPPGDHDHNQQIDLQLRDQDQPWGDGVK